MKQEEGQGEAKRKASRRVWRATWRQTLTTLTIGWDLALPIFGGVLLGHYLDRQLGKGYVFTMGLLVLGLGVGMYNVTRTLQRELRRDQFRVRYRTQQQEEENAERF